MPGNTKEIMEKYLRRLENNPRYQYGTVVSYKKAIEELINLYGTEPPIEKLNKFIADKCRKRQPYVMGCKFNVKLLCRFL